MAITFENAAEWVQSLGNIPLDRICMNPLPGTATEKDLLTKIAKTSRIFDLVDGTLVEKAMGFAESVIGGVVLSALWGVVEEHDLGIVVGPKSTVRLRRGLVRSPGIAFYQWEKLPGRLLPAEEIPNLYPDLAGEVARPSNTREEITQILRDYFLAGVRLVWIIQPRNRSLEVYTSADAPIAILNEPQALDGGDVLPGFTLPLAKLFSKMPPPKVPSRLKKKQ